MSRPNRTSRRVVIGRLEQLDERIALTTGATVAVVSHSGPVPFPVSPIPPFFTHIPPGFNVTDAAPIKTTNNTRLFVSMGVSQQLYPSNTPGHIYFTAKSGHGFNPFPQLYPSKTPGHIHF
jgi:hypothetical protein